MEDANIYIRNMLGGQSGAKQRLSAKGSAKRLKNSMNAGKTLKTATNQFSSTLGHMNSGSSSNLISKGLGKSGKTLGYIGLMVTVADRIATFGINIKEAETGDKVRANNSRATLRTITSLGTNYLYGTIHNELFTKKIISRQNFGLDYYREIYQLNMEGSKTKRI